MKIFVLKGEILFLQCAKVTHTQFGPTIIYNAPRILVMIYYMIIQDYKKRLSVPLINIKTFHTYIYLSEFREPNSFQVFFLDL